MNIGLISGVAPEHCEKLLFTGFSEIGTYLLNNPAIAIFLCLGLGYLLGKAKIKSFTVGATVGTLLVGLLISFILDPIGAFKINSLVKSVFFALFIFTIGYEVGPAFFDSLKKNGLKVILLSVIFAVVAFVLCIVLFKSLHINPGEAAGIVAGALTQSAVLGTAAETIKSTMTGTAQAQAMAQLPIAYAMTYVFGTVGVIVFMKSLAPKMLGVNLQTAAENKIKATGFKEAGVSSVVSRVKARAFKVGEQSSIVGKTVEQMEKDIKETIIVEKVVREGVSIKLLQDTLIKADDIIVVIGNISAMVDFEGDKLSEIADNELLTLDLKKGEAVITAKEVAPDFVEKLSECGIIIMEAKDRSGKKVSADTFAAGCELTLVGPSKAVDKAAASVGYLKDVGPSTDISFLSLGILLGLLIGALSVKISGVPITLGAGGGALVGGLFAGKYQAEHGAHGQIPASTRWFLKSMGLNLFIAVVGLSAGSSFLASLRQMGVTVLILGAVVTLLPHIISLLVGRYVLKMDPVDIIGGLCGAGTCTAALNGVIEETGSSIFAMGYTPGYAVGNVLITVLGPLLVSLLL